MEKYSNTKTYIPAKRRKIRLNPNLILKKIKTALSLKDEQIREIFELEGVNPTRSFIQGVFQCAETSKNYRKLSVEQFHLFLDGLIKYYRGDRTVTYSHRPIIEKRKQD